MPVSKEEVVYFFLKLIPIEISLELSGSKSGFPLLKRLLTQKRSLNPGR